MSDLAAFLTARLDEDEGAAKAAAVQGRWVSEHPAIGVVLVDGEPLIEAHIGGLTEHVARHDPVRVLREVEAKRKILARYEFARNQVAVGNVNEAAGYGAPDSGWPLRADSHELDVRDLAAVYSDHPDYDAAWKA